MTYSQPSKSQSRVQVSASVKILQMTEYEFSAWEPLHQRNAPQNSSSQNWLSEVPWQAF